ncbi:MAG: hypothetical protein ACK4SY_09870 [Pyrobaculum sp.]
MYMGEAKPGCRVEEVANVLRPVVHLEIAYDLVDELASSPEKYIGALQKLARLAVKVQNQLAARRDDFKRRGEEYVKAYEYVSRQLEGLAKRVEELFNCLEKLEERVRRDELKKLATLAISPDRYSMMLKEVIEGR